ncbi:MAG TPA: dTDP-4-dehydrorhamnose 3,5-epimerase [Candidatus Limnocylindrales bacterium]|nr:dTDP-4-dehydrorhamnose 3,5-epimerase [Candidatus Limnocylindrales bacterium]
MMRALSIEGAWVWESEQHPDDRGSFHEFYRDSTFAEVTGGAPMHLAQANCSISRAGVIRGVHYVDYPPSQAKYITCLRGAVFDVVVDVRVGSPTFGRWEAVRLDDRAYRCVFIAEGLGHAFMALTEDATLLYLLSERYAPQREGIVNALDPALGIEWPQGFDRLMSTKDATAPTLEVAAAKGLLPNYSELL